MIFTTVENCLILKKNEPFWVMDGTFKSCPTLFNQLFNYLYMDQLKEEITE